LQFYIIYLKTLKEQFHVYSCIFQRYPCIGLTVEDKVAEINYFFFFFGVIYPKLMTCFWNHFTYTAQKTFGFFFLFFFLL